MNTIAMPVSREFAGLPPPPILPLLGDAHQRKPRRREASTLEAMRLQPATPCLPLPALRETTAWDVRLAADTQPWCALGHDSVAKPCLSIAQRFNRQRWLGKDGAASQLSLPAGAGAGMSPGRDLAWMEIKAATVTPPAKVDTAQLWPWTGAAPAEARAGTMTPAPLAIPLRQRGRCATQGKSNAPMNAYVNS